MFDKKPDLVWVSEYYGPTGYSEEARGFISTLDRCHFNLKIISQFYYRIEDFLTPEQEYQLESLETTPIDIGKAVVVQHRPAHQFDNNIRGRVNIGRIMFETDRLPDEWVERCKPMDEIWVPSHFNLETFSGSGIPSHKLRVIPGGVDVNLYHPAARPLQLGKNDAFAFLSVFDWTERKGWDLLLTAYYDEFQSKEDVMLLIKADKRCTPGLISEQFNSFVRKRIAHKQPSFPMVRVLDWEVPGSLMPAVYTACDAFVLPSRGESWGRPYMEAMACGLPVIGTRWSGNLEFMNDQNSYLIEVEGIEDVPVNVDVQLYSGHKWARPSVEHLRHLMRHVYEHRQEAKARGAQGRSDICQQWTWEHAVSAVGRELEKYST